MRKVLTITLYVLLIIPFSSCTTDQSEGTTEANQGTVSPLSPDTILKSDLTEKEIVSNRFLALIQFIDSVGYSFDSVRFKKTYGGEMNYSKYANLHEVDKYLFYEVPIEKTAPYWHNERIKTDTFSYHQAWRQNWHIDFEKFERVEQITTYFYVQKKPSESDGVKQYIDGVIEEWRFANAQDAMEMAEELGSKETMVYIKRGAYVCYLDNYVYIFHSRAVMYYDRLKGFFEHFVNENNATISNKGELRKAF